MALHSTFSPKAALRTCLSYQQLCLVLLCQLYPAKSSHAPSSLPHLTLEFHGLSHIRNGCWMWLWDAPMGYHQIGIERDLQNKLAFAGPNATKWTYTVMQFMPVNSPATFISYIHEVNSSCKELAHLHSIHINKDTSSNIIADNILSWAKSLMTALVYMECQLCICQSQNLSLSLKKLHIFPKQFEFVVIDVCPEGNRPAIFKHQLLQYWPLPCIVHNLAKFVEFMQFYSHFISNFKIRITPLCKILREDYTTPLGDMWTSEAGAVLVSVHNTILNNPCLFQYDHHKLLLLWTDFSGEGFGYAACQPANDDASLQAMHKCMQGSAFVFMTKDSTATLHLVAFVCQSTCGNKRRLHSHLGEAFSGNYAINKCCYMVFGQHFVWITDCFALKFILSYNRCNPAIL
jgi:hypothetical protein